MPARVRVEAMSKGMQQRLGIAQAMIGSPGLLLLDEPTSALDPAGRRVVRELLVELRWRGIARDAQLAPAGRGRAGLRRVTIIDGGRVVAAARPPSSPAPASSRSRPTGLAAARGCGREAIPDLVRELVAEGRDVFAVDETGSSLEDAYMEVVGSGDRPRGAGRMPRATHATEDER